MARLWHHFGIVVLISMLLGSECQPSLMIKSTTEAVGAPQETESTYVTANVSSGGPLFVNPDNRRYFTDGVKFNGKYRAIYLTGSHTWCNFIDCGTSSTPPTFDYNKYLNFLVTHHYNFFRLWRSETARGGEAGPNFWFTPMPYQRSSTCCAFDGKNKFDLTKFNQSYFTRMRQRIIDAGAQGIYVSVMLFDGWSVESKFGGHDPWPGHPYNKNNNINGVDGDVNKNGQGDDTHKLVTNSPVLSYQEAYVKKVIDTVNDLDNVLYEISNESPGDNPDTPQMDGSKDWQYHMINLIKSYESSKPKQHPVGMTWEWLYGNNQTLYNSPADWISLGGNLNLNTYVPPVTDGSQSSKVIIADTDHLCGICGSQQWVWKSFTHGENPLFMDWYDPATSSRGGDYSNPNEQEVRRNLTYTRDFANRMNLVAMTPQPSLCSTGYCLANPGATDAEYLVFLPSGATVSSILGQLGIHKTANIYLAADGSTLVDLSGSPGKLSVEWFNPSNGQRSYGGDVTGGASRTFTAPFSGDVVLYIHSPRSEVFLPIVQRNN
jgi:hypothetical protein